MVKLETGPVVDQHEKSRTTLHSVSTSSLKAVLSPVEQGIVVLDDYRNLVFANDAARRTLQSKTEDEAFRILMRSVPASIFDQARAQTATATFLDVSHEERSSLIGIEISFFEELFGIPCYVIFMNDFSKWRELDDLHSRFATYLSHHLRTPLTAVRNAVRILSQEEKPLEKTERDKLLDIGWRNVEKLITSLDEIQKIFMIESEEMNVCRTLVRANRELKPLFDDLECQGKIRGYKLKSPEITIFAGRSRLHDFVRTAVDAYWKWMDEAPFIECVYSIREDMHFEGDDYRMLRISLRPRFQVHSQRTRGRLKDFLSYHEAHRGLMLTRIAIALDGEIDIDSKDTVSLLIPFDPPFNREKDLVHPIHVMIERAGLTGCQFHLTAMKMVGEMTFDGRFTKQLEECLCRSICSDGMVSKGEEPLSYSIFVINRSPAEVAEMMKGIHQHFMRVCSESGEEIYPSIRWEVRYSYNPGSDGATIDTPILEDICS
jgi:signal transduction histidine kinase